MRSYKVHPNATITGGAGTVATALIYVLGVLGVSFAPVVAAAIVTIVSTLLLTIGRVGVMGLWSAILHGDTSDV